VTVSEVKAKRLPALDDEFATEAAGFDTLAELRADIATRAREAEARKIEDEFELAVLDSAIAAAEIELPDKLVHARAHEMLEDTLAALERQGISRERYLSFIGMDEEQMLHEAEPEAAKALRREAVIAAIIEAEQIEPTDEQLLEALAPTAKQRKTEPEKLLERLRANDRIEPVRADLAARHAIELLAREAKPISIAAAQARAALWTPDKVAPSDAAPKKLWTPGS